MPLLKEMQENIGKLAEELKVKTHKYLKETHANTIKQVKDLSFWFILFGVM